MTARLYAGADLVGRLLSAWRARAVLPFVRGELLDLACGDNRLVRRRGAGVGVDIVAYEGADTVCPDLERLPFADASFDTVTILAALNYFERPEAVLREVRRVLKPDGRLLISLLHKGASRLWHAVRERHSTPRPALDAAELDACLRAAGLRVTSRRSFMLGLNTIYCIER
ncbi:MAG TPA: methyltransferase domain-containing protein [Myxococcota bacterium]